MSLAPGIRLGPHEIVSPIGAGAMGEVCRARNARLGRDLAIKVRSGQRTTLRTMATESAASGATRGGR